MELIGISKQLKQLREWLENWGYGKKAALLYGPPGVGKTESVYHIAKELEFNVVEYNMSDTRGKEFMERLSRITRVPSIKKTIILLDEADGIESWRGLAEVIRNTVRPIVLTANDVNRVATSVRKLCAEIVYFRPRLRDVLKLAKKAKPKRMKVDFSKLVPDFRQALMVGKYGAEGYKIREGRVAMLQEMLKTGEYGKLSSTDLIVLLDSACKLFTGVDLYMFIRSLEMCDMCRNSHPLYGFKARYKNLGESYFLAKAREFKEVRKDGRV